jgi:hypothetical protein
MLTCSSMEFVYLLMKKLTGAYLRAKSIVEIATEDTKDKTFVFTEKNPAAVALGKLGGLKGGNARAKVLSPKRRSEIARKAANVRWHGR